MKQKLVLKKGGPYECTNREWNKLACSPNHIHPLDGIEGQRQLDYQDRPDDDNHPR
jgi:hypothetical protein